MCSVLNALVTGNLILIRFAVFFLLEESTLADSLAYFIEIYFKTGAIIDPIKSNISQSINTDEHYCYLQEKYKCHRPHCNFFLIEQNNLYSNGH